MKMNTLWRFRLGTNGTDGGREDMFQMFSQNTKTGAADGPRSDGWYDGDWEEVTLPHDWALAAPFVPNGGQGGKPRGIAWYRRGFFVPKEWDGKRLWLRFGGIAIESDVWLNSIHIASCTGGYTPQSVEITDFVRYGGGNVLAVRADNRTQEGWWYEGGGIYREVTLDLTEQVCFLPDGVFVHAERTGEGDWLLTVRGETTGDLHGGAYLLRAECLGQSGSVPMTEPVRELCLRIAEPPLWSVEEPRLVPVRVSLTRGGETVDETILSFGFRTVTFDAENGCFLNEKAIKLKGCCMHDDHAGAGVALTESLERYRVRRLKEMGCNAVRTSHNPYGADFYRACDEEGMLVMDEVRHFSSTTECLAQLEAFVRRDRSHPCVIFWSLYNEEPLQCSPVGEKIAASMKALIHRLDGTRPVSGGMNGALEPEGVVHAVDMMGFNYLQYGYDTFHELHPEMPVFGSENCSWLTGRDLDENSPEEGRLSAWRQEERNLNPWSSTPGATWREIESRPFVAGGFVWTGMDYRGEAQHPAVISNYGAMDLCGFPKDAYWWLRALWREEPVLKLCHKWEGKAGEPVTLRVYTNCETVELFVNGRSVEKRRNDRFDPKPFAVPYEAGEVTAVGSSGGRVLARDTLRTPGRAFRLRLVPAQDEMRPGDRQLAVNVFLEDEAGTVLPEAEDEVRFSVEGGFAAGVGNGDNVSHAPETGCVRKLFHGCCQAIVTPTHSGTMKILACCGALRAETEVTVEDGTPAEEVPAAVPKLVVAPWRMSDVTDFCPEGERIVNQWVNWIPTTVGCGINRIMSGKRGWATVTGQFTVPETEGRLTVVLERVLGTFDLFLGNEEVLSVPEKTDGRYEIPCPKLTPGTNVVLALRFRLDGGEAGILGDAWVRAD